MISKYKAQKDIAVVWFIFSLIIIVLFVVIMLSRHNTSGEDEWKWLITNLSPGLSLITASFIYLTTNQNAIVNQDIDKFFVRLVITASILYLLLLLLLIVTIPIGERDDETPIFHLNRLSFLLSFIQVTLLSLLGIFFTRGK